MKRYPLILAIMAILTVLSSLMPTGYVFSAPNNLAAPKAFPEAMGYGTNTPGGRGGKVIYVTNLNDSGSGSLRTALTASGARTVLFKVAGTITLASDIDVVNPYLTVAGQTAPGEGVQIRGAQIKITTHDVLIRYLKVRSGDSKNSTSSSESRDTITSNHDTNVYNIVIDHSTLIWGPDIGGVTFLNGARDSTVSNSIMGEGLYISNHPEGTIAHNGHSKGMNITELNSPNHPTRISIHHNLLTTSSDRNPRIMGGENIDIVNNVVYNWRQNPSSGNPRSVNLIKNYYIKGPMNTVSGNLAAWIPRIEAGTSLRTSSVFESGNLTEGFTTKRVGSSSVYVTTRFSPYSITAEDSPQDAYTKIVNGAGANLQVVGADGSFGVRRDSVDTRIINNLVGRKGTFLNGVDANGVAGFPSISWPTLANGTPATDGDNDGMADAWETKYFGNTSRGSATSSNSDFDADGYTDLEEYLNGTNPVGASGTAPTQPAPTTPATIAPTKQPTAQPTAQPTTQPTIQPTSQPTAQPTVAPTQAPTSTTLKFIPSDDATVEQDRPTNNFGTSPTLLVDESPNMDFYMKFQVSGVNGQKVTKAVIRLYTVDASNTGGKIKLVPSNDWTERTLTWKTRPGSSDVTITSLAQVKAGSWYEVDVTSAVTGDGAFSFRVLSSSSDGADYSSKEGSNPPQLIVSVTP